MARGSPEDRGPVGRAVSHHDLCFGCGLANPFGLGLELVRGKDARVSGRFFVKQDHQGPDGRAHRGILAAALIEAMSHAVDGEVSATPERVEVDVRGAAAVGTYVTVEAGPDGREPSPTSARAALRDPDEALIAEGRARFAGGEGGAERG
jgi:acyl-coenzyme A thioesterase PaaI-like protein